MERSDPSQLSLIKQLQERLSDVDLDVWRRSDSVILQWIKYADNNLDKAEKSFRKQLAWRKENGVDTIMHEIVSEDILSAHPYKCFLVHNATFIAAVNYVPYGRWKSKSFLRAGRHQEMRRAMMQFCESVDLNNKLAQEAAALSSEGTLYTETVFICDMAGLTLADINPSCMKFGIDVALMVETNYPRTGRQSLFLNGTPLFRFLLKAVVPFLSEHVKKGIVSMGSNKEEWMKEFTKYMSPQQIPISYGGLSEQQYF